MDILKCLGRKSTIAALSGCLLTTTAWAGSNIDALGNLDQNSFTDLTSDLGAALSYKAIIPAEPLGSLGFDIGFEVSSTKMETDALNSATTSSAPSSLVIPKLHLHKGLPFGFDVGAFYTSVPNSNMGLVGGELRYAIIDGSTLIPAISISGTFSHLTGVDDFDLITRGLELSVSKGFAFFTPYAGIGTVWIDSETSNASLNSLGVKDESLTKNKYFLGFNLNLGLMNFAAETEKTGDNATVSGKLGVRF